jgi:hypothetical protein
LNYIRKLRAENAALTARVDAMEAATRDLMSHLTLPKFCGPENAWISTVDVQRFALSILTAQPEKEGS